MSSRSAASARSVGFGAGSACLWPRTCRRELAGRPVEWEESRDAARLVRQQLEEYFAGQRRQFTMPLDLRGTDFQTPLLGGTVAHSLRRDAQLWGDRLGLSAGRMLIAQSDSPTITIRSRLLFRVTACWPPARRWVGTAADCRTKAFLLRLEGAAFRDDASSAK